MNRLLDIGIASLGLMMTSPLLLALGLAVKLDSPGPALFMQTRIGRAQRPFRVAKLRTMTTDGSLPGSFVTATKDPRITRIGALLRMAKLDELPQLWNVLRGDMSIVGPRPEVPVFVARYRPEWRKLFTVRPGLTDVASLTFRDEEGLLALAHDRERAYTEVVMPLKLELALRGVEQASMLRDLAVIARTAASVLRIGRKTDATILEAQRRIHQLNEAEHPS